VAIAYDPEEMEDYTAKYSYILSKNLPVLIYAGEFDMKDGPNTQEVWMRNIQLLKENPTFWTQTRKIYYF